MIKIWQKFFDIETFEKYKTDWLIQFFTIKILHFIAHHENIKIKSAKRHLALFG